MHARYPWTDGVGDMLSSVDEDERDDLWSENHVKINNGKILDTEYIEILLNDVYRALIA
jgi:hypothetical protein